MNAANNTKAIEAFMARKMEVDAMLGRLQALSGDHFGYSPDDINWGHVGTLAHYAELLKRITDCAFNEGEHAAYLSPCLRSLKFSAIAWSTGDNQELAP